MFIIGDLRHDLVDHLVVEDAAAGGRQGLYISVCISMSISLSLHTYLYI